jgi:hypothetical protein
LFGSGLSPNQGRQQVLKKSDLLSGAQNMGKEKRSNKESKKKPAMTAKEKKAAKRSKNSVKSVLSSE